MKRVLSLLLLGVFCLGSAGCAAAQLDVDDSLQDSSDQLQTNELNLMELSADELAEYYDAAAYAGAPRVVEGFFGQKVVDGVSIDVVDTWESDHDKALELILPSGKTIEDYAAVYCIIVDNNTTCDFSDDVMVHYWLIADE